MPASTHERAGFHRRLLTVVLVLAASLASTAARAQDNAAPLWRAAFKAAGYGTEAPLLAAEDQAFIADLAAQEFMEDHSEMFRRLLLQSLEPSPCPTAS